METLSTNVYTNLQSYWRRRAYERLEKTSTKKKLLVRLGGGRKRAWRVKAGIRKVFRLPIKILSPKKLLVRLRDAYVGAMLAFAGDVPSTKKIPKIKDRTGTEKLSGFETKMILQIYNRVMSNPRELMMIRARAENSAEVESS